jgi:hypothetical protein
MRTAVTLPALFTETRSITTPSCRAWRASFGYAGRGLRREPGLPCEAPPALAIILLLVTVSFGFFADREFVVE